MEVLEALVELERENHPGIDVVEGGAQQPGEVQRVIRFDQRSIAERGQQLGARVRALMIDVVPADVPLDRPRSAVGGCRGADVDRLSTLSLAERNHANTPDRLYCMGQLDGLVP